MEGQLEFIKRLAKDDRDGRTAKEVLSLLWDIAHDVGILRSIVDIALQSHVKTRSSFTGSSTDEDKQTWLDACVVDLKAGVLLVPILKHLQNIGETYIADRPYYQRL